jgi:hypothetical protein
VVQRGAWLRAPLEPILLSHLLGVPVPIWAGQALRRAAQSEFGPFCFFYYCFSKSIQTYRYVSRNKFTVYSENMQTIRFKFLKVPDQFLYHTYQVVYQNNFQIIYDN